jgi:transposase
MEIRILKKQGQSIRQIAKDLGLSSNTAREYLRKHQEPNYQTRPVQERKLDKYQNYLIDGEGQSFTASRAQFYIENVFKRTSAKA